MRVPVPYAIILCVCALTPCLAGKPNQVRAYYQQQSGQQGPGRLSGTDNSGSIAEQNAANKESPLWYASPEWILVIVGSITFIIIGWQAWETRRAASAAAESVGAINRQAVIMERQTAATEKAAEATKKSVELQEVALRPWVTIENWRSTIFLPEGGGLSLHVQFDVFNPTDLPLMLDYAYIIFMAHGFTDEGGKAGRSNLIPPRKGHPVTITVKITEEQRSKWEHSELVFLVSGYVKFVDALEKERRQPFNGSIGCSERGVRFIPPYGPGLYIADEKKSG